MVPAQLAGNMDTSQRNIGTEKAKKFQNFTAMTKSDMSRKTVER